MNFELAIQSLSDAGVEFIIIWGWSAVLHGSAYVTNDLDLFFSRKPDNLRRLAEALAPYHPRLILMHFCFSGSSSRNYKTRMISYEDW